MALALEKVVPLVTADRQLFGRSRARAELAPRVKWLGDLRPSGVTAGP